MGNEKNAHTSRWSERERHTHITEECCENMQSLQTKTVLFTRIANFRESHFASPSSLSLVHSFSLPRHISRISMNTHCWNADHQRRAKKLKRYCVNRAVRFIYIYKTDALVMHTHSTGIILVLVEKFININEHSIQAITMEWKFVGSPAWALESEWMNEHKKRWWWWRWRQQPHNGHRMPLDSNFVRLFEESCFLHYFELVLKIQLCDNLCVCVIILGENCIW